MSVEQLVAIIVTAAVTGAGSTLGTVVALKVHISYLKEAVDRLDKSVTRAHMRIDEMQRRLQFKG